MGRAQSSAAASAQPLARAGERLGGFDALLGARRGRGQEPRFAPARLSADARAQLRSLRAKARRGELQEALAVLCEHRAYIRSRPALGALAGAVTDGASARTLRERRTLAAQVMSLCGVHPRFAQHVVQGTNPALLGGQLLHLWADGERFAGPAQVRERAALSLTVCGQDIIDLDAVAVTRGAWRTKSARGRGECCERCARHAEEFYECSETRPGAQPTAPERTAERERALKAALSVRVADGFEDEQSLLAFACAEHDRLLAAQAAQRYAQNPELVLRRLDGERFKALVRTSCCEEPWKQIAPAAFGDVVRAALALFSGGPEPVNRGDWLLLGLSGCCRAHAAARTAASGR